MCAGWHPPRPPLARPTRVRNLARSLDLAEDDVLLWLLEHAPELGDLHAADFVPPAVEARARLALSKPPAPVEATEPRCLPCQAAPASGARVVPAEGGVGCARCGDSVNRREALALIDAFAEHGLRRLLVVGGGPGTAEELRALLGEALELRIVDGEDHREATQAGAELAWADVVAIWGSTILPHKVSKLYTDRRNAYRDKLVTVPRRGAAALCTVVVEKVKGGRAGRR